MMNQSHYPNFFTATILDWKPLLELDHYKDIIISSLDYLVRVNRIAIYGFVIMINHLHLIWHIADGYRTSDIQRDFMKYTAQRIQKHLRASNPFLLEEFKVNASDRAYQIWQKNALSVDLHSENMLRQKLQYIHENPVRAGIVKHSMDYKYSSASFYEGFDGWPFLKHYAGYV